MSDRPIIFSAPMVRALLDGRKTQTRRLAWNGPKVLQDGTIVIRGSLKAKPTIWQRAQAGDHLWVRENLRLGATSTAWCYAADDRLIALDYADHRVAQMVGWAHHQERASVPSIHMPRWASRLTLTVTDVRRQPLQEITEEDARAEGISWSDEYEGYHTEECRHYHGAWPSRSFSSLWRSLHGEEAWDANPEVVALTFTVAQAGEARRAETALAGSVHEHAVGSADAP